MSERRHSSQSDDRDLCDGREVDAIADTSAPDHVPTLTQHQTSINALNQSCLQCFNTVDSESGTASTLCKKLIQQCL